MMMETVRRLRMPRMRTAPRGSLKLPLQSGGIWGEILRAFGWREEDGKASGGIEHEDRRVAPMDGSFGMSSSTVDVESRPETSRSRLKLRINGACTQLYPTTAKVVFVIQGLPVWRRCKSQNYSELLPREDRQFCLRGGCA